jgi:hypothetical protein
LHRRRLRRELEAPVGVLIASLASKWLAITNTGLPLNVNSPTNGLRLEFHTGLVGSILPGDNVRSGPPWLLTTCVPVVDRLVDAGPRSTNVTGAGL